MAKDIITKSEFKEGMKCPKHLWLKKHRPELKSREELNQTQIEGIEVGKMATSIFDNVTVIPDAFNTTMALRETKKALGRGDKTIAEAAIEAGDLLCKVDILEVLNDGVVINEVKAKNNIRKKSGVLNCDLLYDFSFQYYVLTEAGFNVKKINCIYLNKEYVRHGELDYNELFISDDVTRDVLDYVMAEDHPISEDIDFLRDYLKHKEMPEDSICSDCRDCEMAALCWKDIPTPSVWNLNGNISPSRAAWYKTGLITYEQLLEAGILNKKAEMQVRAELYDEKYINKKEISKFLEKIYFPLYFLDFETYSVAVPEYDNQKPYDKVPFQFSLHYICEKGCKLNHVEYLADEHTDPRREVAERLINTIPQGACVTAYYKSFECGRLNELADLFPDMSERLREISNGIVDFIEPFKNYHYLTKGMEGKASIKLVVPALYPNDESLNYANLPGVKKGDQAMDMFLKLRTMGAEERLKERENMLKYCELDTFAMVKIYEALLAAVE